MRTMARALALPASDRALLLRAFAWVVAMRIGLWVVPFSRLRRAADRLGPAGAPAAPTRIAWAVEAAGRRVPAASCLTRALAADAMLRRAGRSPEIRLGVAKADDGVEAHAWLSLDGEVLVGGHDLHRYTPLRGAPV
ncbi:MAG TPA: lasso peptide biosynthesis B2 protein [Actinomycetota bacterium]|nr:lasso peptide biosynthesis B2 protein [Actinomycetota bacterium]